MQQNIIHLHTIEYFVLDEADRMLDMGFIHDIKRYWLNFRYDVNLCFSATMPPTIVQLAHSILRNPVSVEVTPVSLVLLILFVRNYIM